MHSTTNNPNLRKNFVGNLLKKLYSWDHIGSRQYQCLGWVTPLPLPPQTITTTPQYLHTVAMWCIQEEGPESPDSFILLCFFTISLKPKFF